MLHEKHKKLDLANNGYIVKSIMDEEPIHNSDLNQSSPPLEPTVYPVSPPAQPQTIINPANPQEPAPASAPMVYPQTTYDAAPSGQPYSSQQAYAQDPMASGYSQAQPTMPPMPDAAMFPPAPTKGGGKFGKILCFFVILLLLGLAGSTTVLALSLKEANQNNTELEAEKTAMDANDHELPDGAIKVSECVPNMGFHYLPKDADPLFGPFLLVSKAGRLIGYEYMFSEDMFESIPAEIPLEIIKTKGPILLNDWDYNSIDISRAPAGHPGFEKSHIDIHLYTVTPDIQQKACE